MVLLAFQEDYPGLSGEWTGQEQEREQGAREEIHVVGHGEGIN